MYIVIGLVTLRCVYPHMGRHMMTKPSPNYPNVQAMNPNIDERGIATTLCKYMLSSGIIYICGYGYCCNDAFVV